jgi:hypothetical protein
MTAGAEAPFFDGTFPHRWLAEVLPSRPLILPPRHFVYPRDAEEIERGALEVLIRLAPPPVYESTPKHPQTAPSLDTQPFLATCALGFRDPAVPTGLWSTPNPVEICAVSGGYAYLIDTTAPERFTMIPYRPVLELLPIPAQNLLLFIGHHAILAWGPIGEAWQTERLSSEGITHAEVVGEVLHGMGWDMITDKETPFALDLRTGRRTTSAS